MEMERCAAEAAGRPAILFCHFPLFPVSGLRLWDGDAVWTILRRHSCVRAWINGHDHGGAYTERGGIHFLTLHGMAETEKETAFAVAAVFPDRIEIRGFGREPSRTLRFRVPSAGVSPPRPGGRARNGGDARP